MAQKKGIKNDVPITIVRDISLKITSIKYKF